MKEKIMNTFTHLLLPILFGAIVAAIVIAALKGKAFPSINTPRASLVALLVVGLTICFQVGVGQIGHHGRWDSPLAITGILLGFAILVIFISALTSWKSPLISGEIQVVTAVGISITIKQIFGPANFSSTGYSHLLSSN